MKISKLFCAFCALFIVVGATAQVLESVSYTPSKKGVYNTIASKKVTSFSGSLNAETIYGQGHKLTLNTGSKHPYFATSTSIELGAAKDVYMPYNTPAVSSATIANGGKLYTTSSAVSITNTKAGLVYGDDTNFSSVDGTLASTGVLDIADVIMQNPGCNIQWVSLPAYKESQDYSETRNTIGSGTSYWFAYCASAQATNNPTWVGTQENKRLYGTCTAGWDGESVTGDANTDETNKCTHNANATQSHFTCTAQTISTCSVSGFSVNYIQSGDYSVACNSSSRSSFTKTASDNYEPDYDSLPGLCNKAERRIAKPVEVESIGDNEYKSRLPSSDINSVGCSESTSNYSANSARAAYKIGIRKLFCGQNSNSTTEADTAINSWGEMVCPGTLVSQSYDYCSELYGAGYSTSIANNNICTTIAQRNATLAGLDSFTCIKRGPDKKAYRAYRVGKCTAYNHLYNGCSDVVCGDKCIVNMRRSGVSKVKPDPFTTPASLDCSSVDQYKNPPASDKTIYLNQVVEGSILTCTKQ